MVKRLPEVDGSGKHAVGALRAVRGALGNRVMSSQYELTFLIKEVNCLLFVAFSADRLMAMATAV